MSPCELGFYSPTICGALGSVNPSIRIWKAKAEGDEEDSLFPVTLLFQSMSPQQ